VIAAVVLAAGCEQWKAPGKIHELEGRVDELSRQVAALKGGAPEAAPEAKPRSEHGEKPAAAEPPAGHEGAGHAAAEPAAKASEGKDDKADRHENPRSLRGSGEAQCAPGVRASESVK